MPDDTNLALLPDDTNLALLPDDTNLALLPDDTNPELLPDDAVADDTTIRFEISPEIIKTANQLVSSFTEPKMNQPVTTQPPVYEYEGPPVYEYEEPPVYEYEEPAINNNDPNYILKSRIVPGLTGIENQRQDNDVNYMYNPEYIQYIKKLQQMQDLQYLHSQLMCNATNSPATSAPTHAPTQIPTSHVATPNVPVVEYIPYTTKPIVNPNNTNGLLVNNRNMIDMPRYSSSNSGGDWNVNPSHPQLQNQIANTNPGSDMYSYFGAVNSKTNADYLPVTANFAAFGK